MLKEKNVKALDVRIKQLTLELDKCEKGTAKYSSILENIRQLSETRKVLAPEPNPQNKLNWNTVFSGVISMAGILVVTQYEKMDIITSKAYNIATRLFK